MSGIPRCAVFSNWWAYHIFLFSQKLSRLAYRIEKRWPGKADKFYWAPRPPLY